jgi:serine phosphatase RsbU (regulator of sigma subunit)
MLGVPPYFVMQETFPITSSLPPEALASHGNGLPPQPISAHARRLKYLERLASASRALSELRDPARVAEILCEQTLSILEADAASVLLIGDDGRIRVQTSGGLSVEAAKMLSGPVSEVIVTRALKEERMLQAWDLRQSDNAHIASWAVGEGIVSTACVPMISGGVSVGALNLYMRRSRHFSEDFAFVLSLLAGQGATALNNARNYETLKRHSQELRQAFQRVGEALSTSLDIGETLKLIVRLAVSMTGADAGAVYLLQDEREGVGLRLMGVQGIDRRSMRYFRAIAVPPYARQSFETRKAEIIPDTRRYSAQPFPTLRLASDQVVETRAALCIPLFSGDRPLGILEQYYASVGGPLHSDVELLTAFANQASVAIRNARLYEQEYNIAQTLQKAFLPELPPLVNGLEVGRIYVSGSVASSVGGDTYDLLKLRDGRVAALVADVTGKGTAAATVAILARDIARAYALEDPEPSSVLRRLNEAMCSQSEATLYLTLIYALIEPTTGRVQIASAGHPPALICRGDTRVCTEWGVETGMLIGLLKDQHYPQCETTLQHGDALLLYTDGVVEARRGKEQFGQERLERAFNAAVHLPAQEIASILYAAVADFVHDERNDDIALLALKPHA